MHADAGYNGPVNGRAVLEAYPFRFMQGEGKMEPSVLCPGL